jgi:hypothetical protein
MKKLLIFNLILIMAFGVFAQTQPKIKKTVPEQLLDLGLSQIIIFPDYNPKLKTWQWKVTVNLLDGTEGTKLFNDFWDNAIFDGSGVKRVVIKGFIQFLFWYCLDLNENDITGTIIE